ncbi:MAG: OmpA family protein [Saprospiraceae bacterium]|nr:OmpA family protein [Saprospiraceae bacterium]
MRNLLALLFLLAWLILGWFSYQCSKNCKGVGDAMGVTTGVVDTAASTAVVKATGPLLYKYSSGDAITNDGWAARKKEILDALGADKLLEITGLYGKNEANTTTFENLGLARADAARKLFTEIPDDRVRLLSRMLDGDPDKVNPFEACDFGYKVNTENVKEVADKTMIYFPFNSTNKLNSAEVETYLKDVAARVKTSGEKVVLTGHTDNVGDDDSNVKLGQRRSNIVRDYLISQGVSAAQITANSAGESQPIATNDTDAGRQQNRRTELQIIK